MTIPLIVKRVAKYTAICISILFFVGIAYAVYYFSGNKAQDTFKPMAKSISALHAKKICSNGDGGKGLDNDLPWYQVYYSVINSPNLDSEIKSAAAGIGYNLTPDTHAISQTDSSVPGYANTTYLIGYSNGGQLTVSIAHTGDKVYIECPGRNGEVATADANEAILDFSLNLPRRHDYSSQ